MKKPAFIIFALALAVFGGIYMGRDVAGEAAAPRGKPEKIHVVRSGSQTTAKAPAERFTGDVSVSMFFPSDNPSGKSGGIVSFGAGARTAWHTHPNGQLIVIVSGAGRVQEWGGPVIEVGEGDVVWFPTGVKHWHGAAPGTAMALFSMADIVDGKSTTWMEHVTDRQYNGK